MPADPFVSRLMSFLIGLLPALLFLLAALAGD